MDTLCADPSLLCLPGGRQWVYTISSDGTNWTAWLKITTYWQGFPVETIWYNYDYGPSRPSCAGDLQQVLSPFYNDSCCSWGAAQVQIL